jgi:hypothetical protein
MEKGGRRKERGVQEFFKKSSYSQNINPYFFSFFLNFLTCKKKHKHPPKKEHNKHHQKARSICKKSPLPNPPWKKIATQSIFKAIEKEKQTNKCKP